MKRLILPVVFCCLVAPAGAQIKSNRTSANYSASWQAGSVIFQTGDSLHCNLRYNHAVPYGVLQIMEGDNVLTLSSEDVKSFYFYDAVKGRNRKFYSIPPFADQPAAHNFFMECLYYDEQFSILNHKTIGVPYDYMNYSRFVSKPAPISKKYILNTETGELFPMSRENALRMMEKRKAQVLSYIQSHRIRFKSVSDYIHVFEYHSSL
jgi:hypothetical protein